MAVLYRRGQATVAEVQAELPDELAPSTVRTLLGILVEKSQVVSHNDRYRQVFQPRVPKAEMARVYLRGVLRTFFDGSLEAAMSSLLEKKDMQLRPEELDRLSRLIEEARKEQP